MERNTQNSNQNNSEQGNLSKEVANYGTRLSQLEGQITNFMNYVSNSFPTVPVVHQLITTNLMISNFQDKNTGSDRTKIITKSNNNSINNAINNNNISDNINYTYLKIRTHNIRGFNLEFKQREFFDEYNSLNLDIIGITETKLPSK